MRKEETSRRRGSRIENQTSEMNERSDKVVACSPSAIPDDTELVSTSLTGAKRPLLASLSMIEIRG
jgi:hypothetical protein